MSTEPKFDVEKVRAEFPALDQMVNNHPLVYLDNAASSQKPRCVIEAVDHYYRHDCSNVHRGAHELSARATASYESVRGRAAKWLNAEREHEILFVRGTTEGINLVAQTFGRTQFQAGDRILISEMEHHSNIVPWQLIAQETGAEIHVIPVTMKGEIDLNSWRALLDERVKLVALAHVSNALGTINPIAEMIAEAHEVGAKVLIDGAQAAPHGPVNVKELDCDFYVLSGHKIFAPNGIGLLYGKEALLEAMPPWQGGGDMIDVVSFEGTTFNALPHKFEAGTPNVAGTIGLGAALQFMEGLDFSAASRHEDQLLAEATRAFESIDGLQIYGRAEHKTGVLSFTMDGAHAQDIGTLLDQQGIAVRAGHHCTQPLMKKLGVAATARASFAFYNNASDVERLIAGVQKAGRLFGMDS